MRATILRASAVLVALLGAGCGGAGHAVPDSRPGSSNLSCQVGMAFVGTAPHAALPSDLFPATAGSAATDKPLPSSLTAMLDRQVADLLRTTGAPAVSVAIALPGLGRWSSAQGLAQTQPAQTVADGTEFYWVSVAKTLTAVLVLQLVEEGKLSLNDSLSRWFPQIPQAQHMTIAHLLSHTSGLQTNPNSASGLEAETPAQQLATLASMPLLFCPGTDVSYSNAGYLMLALVVEAVEQRSMYQSAQSRIAAPLGLLHLRALRPGEDSVATLASPHLGQAPKADPGAWTRLGAGNVVARAEDMAAFWQAVLSGRLLNPGTVQAQWAVLRPLGPLPTEPNQGMQWFGKGVMLTEWTDTAGRARSWLGHFGGIPTANAVVLYDPAVDAYVAVAVNSEVSSAAVANALLATVSDWRAKN